jgi:hypothetical protein
LAKNDRIIDRCKIGSLMKIKYVLDSILHMKQNKKELKMIILQDDL